MRIANLSIAWKQDLTFSEMIDLSWFHFVLRRICPSTEVVVPQIFQIDSTLQIWRVSGTEIASMVRPCGPRLPKLLV
jgi:hypothetical protein